MKKYTILLSSLFIYCISIAQTKLHPDWTQEDQERWVNTMQEKFPFEISDIQWDSMIVLHQEYRKNFLRERAENLKKARLGEKTENVPYHQKFYPVLTPEQREHIEDYDTRKAAAKVQQEIWKKENSREFFETRKAAKKLIEETMDPLLKTQHQKLEEILTAEEKEEIEKIQTDEKLYQKIFFEINSLGTKAFAESEFEDLTLSKAERQKRFDEFAQTETFKKLKKEFFAIKEHNRAKEDNFSVIIRRNAIVDKHTTKIRMLIDEINPQIEVLRKKVFDLYDNHYTDAPLRKINEQEFWVLNDSLMYSDIGKYRFNSYYWEFLTLTY